MAQVGPGQVAADQHRRAKQLVNVEARDPDLPEAARTAKPDLRLVDVVDRHPQPADVVQVDPDPGEAPAYGVAHAVDVHLGDDAVGVAERVDVHVGHVARRVEANLDPPLRGGHEPVCDPRGRGVAVERRDRAVLGELQLARDARAPADTARRPGRTPSARWLPPPGTG